MTVNGANFLQYIPKEGGSSAESGTVNFAQAAGQTWAAGGLFIDANASEEQKVQAVSSTITSLLKLFGANEAGAANKEVQENEQAAANLNESIRTTAENTNSKVNELVSQMQNVAANIQAQLDKINDDNKEKEEQQKKLQEHLETIDLCKGILENANSTSAERTVAIEKLKAAGKGITEISQAIAKIQANSEDEQDQVEDLSSDQTDINDQVDTTIQGSTQQMEVAASKVSTQQATNTTTQVTGTVNETTSATAKATAASVRAAAQSSSFIPIVGSAASASGEALALKLDQVSGDQKRAALSRIPSAVQTLAKVAASEIARQTSLTDFANLSAYALGASDEASAISNTFYSFLEPIGAWLEADNTEDQADKLNSATQTASEQVEAQKEAEENSSNTVNSPQNNDSQQGDGTVKLEFETDDLEELSA